MKKFIILCFMILLVPFISSADESILKETAIKNLKGLKEYSCKIPYSQSIISMYLGYDNTDKIKRGIAFREFKTYSKVTAMVMIEETDGKLIVKNASIPDIGMIKDKEKQDIVLKVVDAFNGKTVRENINSPVVKVDAVTGATRYYNAIYATFNLLIEKTAEEMKNNPSWEKVIITE